MIYSPALLGALTVPVGVNSHLNKYKNGMHAPPLEKLIQLAGMFDVSLDFLVMGLPMEDSPIRNGNELLRKRPFLSVLAPSRFFRVFKNSVLHIPRQERLIIFNRFRIG